MFEVELENRLSLLPRPSLLQKHLEWRKKNLPIYYEEVYEELKKGKWFRRGFTRNGNPVVVVTARKFDPQQRDLRTALRSIIFIIEECIAEMQPGITQALVVYDRRDYTRENTDMEFVKTLARELSDNYPETLLTCLIYPTGFLFRAIWAICKWFFDPKTRDKITPAADLAPFKNFCDDDQLLTCFGGKDDFVFDGNALPQPSELPGFCLPPLSEIEGHEQEGKEQQQQQQQEEKQKQGETTTASTAAATMQPQQQKEEEESREETATAEPAAAEAAAAQQSEETKQEGGVSKEEEAKEAAQGQQEQESTAAADASKEEESAPATADAEKGSVAEDAAAAESEQTESGQAPV